MVGNNYLQINLFETTPTYTVVQCSASARGSSMGSSVQSMVRGYYVYKEVWDSMEAESSEVKLRILFGALEIQLRFGDSLRFRASLRRFTSLRSFTSEIHFGSELHFGDSLRFGASLRRFASLLSLALAQ